MDITDLSIDCDTKGTTVKVWAKCRTPDDVDTMVAWLQLAKGVMKKWDRLRRQEHAEASRSPQTAPSQDEVAEPR